MNMETRLEGHEWLPRHGRIDVGYDVIVHCRDGAIRAQVLNISNLGFRIKSRKPLEVGWAVVLEMPRATPVKAVIRWVAGLDAGGVFAEPVAL